MGVRLRCIGVRLRCFEDPGGFVLGSPHYLGGPSFRIFGEGGGLPLDLLDTADHGLVAVQGEHCGLEFASACCEIAFPSQRLCGECRHLLGVVPLCHAVEWTLL